VRAKTLREALAPVVLEIPQVPGLVAADLINRIWGFRSFRSILDTVGVPVLDRIYPRVERVP
jgi:hypothetical protein